MVKKTLNFVLVIFLVIILGCNIYKIIAKEFWGVEYPGICGYYCAVVISGSMSGSIEVNDMVIIHQEEDYSAGDIISYKTENSLVTHRIIEKTDAGFKTKGDANNTEDNRVVLKEHIIGKVVQIIPGIGIIYDLQSAPSVMALLILVAILCFLCVKKEENERLFYDGG